MGGGFSPSSTTYIYCFRHGEDVCQHFGSGAGFDTVLSREGRSKLRNAFLACAMPKMDKVVVGKMARTIESGSLLACYSGTSAPLEIDESLNSKKENESFCGFYSRINYTVQKLSSYTPTKQTNICVVANSLGLRTILYNAYETLARHTVDASTLSESQVKNNIRKPGYGRFFVLVYKDGNLCEVRSPEIQLYRGRSENQTFPKLCRSLSVPDFFHRNLMLNSPPAPNLNSQYAL